ncbi:hypothetical protein KAR91_55875 [Candidatus Pacearchaeota archaeon]|nr:hypothetical protein [Candidatus Pacearchaeota archaeon]
MIGLPKVFNTKDDYLNVVALVINNGADPTEMIKKLQSLLNTQTRWVGKGTVDEYYSPAPDEKVMTQTEGEGESKITTYQLFKSEDDPNSAFTRLGFTEDEINQLLNDLEGQ